MILWQNESIGQDVIVRLPHNRCGHDPDNLRSYQTPAFHNERPPLLQRAVVALEKGAQYFSRNRRRLLNVINILNPSARQKRSERREALLLVLGRILHYTDIASFNVGVPKSNGTFYFASVEEIAKDTGLHHQRALRALHDAEAARYVKLFLEKNPTTGHHFYRIAVQYLLFIDLGIGRYFVERARTYAQKKQDKKMLGGQLLQGMINVGTNIKSGIKNPLSRMTKTAHKVSKNFVASPLVVSLIQKSTVEQERARLERYFTLRAQCPNRSNAELYQEIYGRALVINTS